MFRRRLQAGRQDELYPVEMTGPDSFMLDGHEYTGKPQTAGKRFSAGERAYVGFAGIARRQAIILAGATRQQGAKNSLLAAVENVLYWLQSNFGPGQNAVGGRLDATLLNPSNSTTFWRLPTHTDSGIDEIGQRAIGLGRVNAPTRNWDSGSPSGGDPTDVLLAAWPQKNADDEVKIVLGAYRTADQVHLWTATGPIFDPWTNPDYPLQAKFFIDSGNGWGHVLPVPTSNSPGIIFSAASRDLKFESNISRASGDGLNLANVSLFSFTPDPTEEVPSPPLESYLCCPATPQTSGSGQASVDFLKMNQATGEWESHASFDSADLPDGGDAAFPDGLPMGSETGSPVSIKGNEAVLIWSGGQLDLFDSEKWVKGHWAIRSLKPDGTAGAFLKSKTFTATDSPALLDPGSMKAAVAAKEYPLSYSTPGTWLEGISYSDDTSLDYEHFGNACPVFLPVDAPNLGRLATISSRLATNHSNTLQWPLTRKNFTGGTVTDSAGTVWSCILEPTQILCGGEYTQEENGTHPAWGVFFTLSVTGSPPVSNTIYFGESTVEMTLGASTFFISAGETKSDVIFDGDGNVLYGYYAEMGETSTDWPLLRWKWNQYRGTKWNTILRGHKDNGDTIEKDISQLLDAYTSAVLGFPDTELVTVFQSNFEVANNVQLPISFPDQGLVAVLRDLHADGATGNPTPHLEVYEVDNEGLTLNLLSTVRLGSYGELKGSDGATWRTGDQEWDPYYFGPPRMKSCLDSDGAPQIVILIGENKKVDLSTDSGFKRAVYHVVSLADPSAPTVNTVALTSPDEGVGASGDVPTDWPLWWEWDTLVLTAGHVPWIKDGKFRESNP